ncbi:MAG: endonuclease/exonuclease/phosphatase family protein [Acidimicrobiia bacterium]|nr:endonuclease/exonuclease/phosphatase family protein [Acidimicrobiia bacterium]NNL13906.1 endonuclease/exonuclease/phosphatase family protein [Acidimicrobiia bacterium]
MTARWSAGMAGIAVGIVVVLGTLLGFLGRASWVFDLVGNFRFQYLWLGVLALIALIWNRWWIPVGVVAVAVAINVLAVGPYWWGSIADPTGPERLTIVHLNTAAGNPEKERVVDFVRTAEADVILLAEVTPALLDLLEEADLEFQPVAGTPARTRVGLLALTRDPSVTGRLTNLGVSEVPAVLLNLDLGDEPIEMLGFHTSSPGREARSSARDDQLAGAGRRVLERESPMVLIGDFNATPWTGAFRDLLDTGLIDGQRGRGVAGSWPAGWGPFKIPIDHALHTPELTTTSFSFGESAGSDHRSLTVTIARAAGS